MLQPLPVQASREDLFVERYHKLYAWSLQMTEHDYELAEDLLHDLFIQFTLNAPQLHEIRNLDAYLYTMLRNLHIVQRRRETRKTLQQLSIVEYDSAEIGLRRVDFRDQIQAQEDLRRVAVYACARKETSKIASVLILRFFHGYYPEEIIKIMRTSRAFIDTGLKLARKEAKAGLLPESSESNRLEFIKRISVPEVIPTGYAQNFDVVLDEIREMIFQTKQGDCRTDETLNRTYSTDNNESVGCLELSHFVSCESCLDRVNKLLGLPLLSGRNATETLGRDARKRGGRGRGPGSGGGGGLSELKLKRLRRGVKETLVHKPMELCVAVNGYTLGSQRVSSGRSELNLVVDEEIRPSFVEVFTEQNIRLLLMPIDELPPDGPAERAVRMRLSDERVLDVTLRLASSSPTIQVAYSDPHFNEVQDIPAPIEAISVDTDFERPSTSLMVNPAPDSEASEESPAASLEAPAADLSRPSVLQRFLRAVANSSFWLRPSTVTALAALILVAVLAIFLRHVPNPPLSATDLLQRAAASEELIASNRDQVIHRTLRLEEKSSAGQLISSRRIEIWQSAEKGITARRLYDESGSLIAGDWRRADGVQTIYHHGRKPELQLAPERRGRPAINFETIWQLDPAAKAFIALVGGAQNAHAQVTDNAYVINYGDSNGTSLGLVSASLVLRRADLRAFEQTLVVRQAREVREYKLTEISFETRRSDSVAPAVFEPESELLSSTKLETPNSKLETEPASPLALGPSPVMATAALEVDVVDALNKANAFMGEQISVTRDVDGKVNVSALVETPERKRDLLAALASFKNNPAVRSKVETVAEAQARARLASGATTIQPSSVDRMQVTETESPVFAELKKRFSDDEARRYSDRVRASAQQAWLHAAAMKQLSQRFSAADLQSLSVAQRSRWLALIRGHADSFIREVEGLRRLLGQVFPQANINPPSADSIDSDTELQARVRELHDVGVFLLRSTDRSFDRHVGQSEAVSVKSSAYWSSFSKALSLARSLQAVK